MATNQQGKTAQGTDKKAKNRKKAPSQGTPQTTVTPENAAAQAAATKAPGGKKVAPRRTSRKDAPREQVSAEERYRMIQEAAYFRAEKEGFKCDPWRCWLVAEAEIDAGLAGSR